MKRRCGIYFRTAPPAAITEIAERLFVLAQKSPEPLVVDPALSAVSRNFLALIGQKSAFILQRAARLALARPF